MQLVVAFAAAMTNISNNNCTTTNNNYHNNTHINSACLTKNILARITKLLNGRQIGINKWDLFAVLLTCCAFVADDYWGHRPIMCVRE